MDYLESLSYFESLAEIATHGLVLFGIMALGERLSVI